MAEITNPQDFVVAEPLIMLFIDDSYAEFGYNAYEASRRAWRLNVHRARQYNLVLSRYQNQIVGAFRPTKWDTPHAYPGRWGWVGEPAEREAQQRYVGKRVPVQYQGRSAVRYLEPPGCSWNERTGKLEWQR